MKLLPILLIILSLSAYAEEECVFDESTYIQFIKKYSMKHSHSKIDPDGKTLIINRNNEKIIIKGGGCIHLGMAIELRTSKVYTEKQFLQKTLDLSTEFGNWLINTKVLKNSIEKEKYQKINGIYFFDINAMTVFSATNDNHGKINVDFYIN